MIVSNIKSIYNILDHFRLPQKLIGLIKTSLKKSMIKIKVGNVLSRGSDKYRTTTR